MTLSTVVMEEAIRYALTCAAWHAALGALSALALLALYYLILSLTASSLRAGAVMLSLQPRVWFWLSLAAFGLGLFGHAYADWQLPGLEWWRW
jgi:steroid 5-alpha reductase family enzyme